MELRHFSPRAVRTSSTVVVMSLKEVAAVTVLVPAAASVPTNPSALVLENICIEKQRDTDSETDRKRQRETETERDRERQRETETEP